MIKTLESGLKLFIQSGQFKYQKVNKTQGYLYILTQLSLKLSSTNLKSHEMYSIGHQENLILPLFSEKGVSGRMFKICRTKKKYFSHL